MSVRASVLLGILLLLEVVGKSYGVRDSGSPEISVLAAYQKETQDALRIDKRLFKNIMLEKGYEQIFTYVTLFTTTPACEPCSPVEQSFDKSARIFRERFGIDRKVLFIVVALEPESVKDRELAVALQLQFVPIIYTFTPGREKPKPIAEKAPAMLNSARLPTVAIINEYVTTQTGLRIPVPMSGPVYVAPAIIKARYYIIGVALLAVIVILATGLHRKKAFWYFVAMFIFCFSLSGGHYTLIHNPPLLVFKSDSIQILSEGGQRHQYVAEGLIWCQLVLMFSGAMYGLKSLPGTKFNMFLKVFISLIHLAVMFCSFSFATLVFTQKTPQYMRWEQA